MLSGVVSVTVTSALDTVAVKSAWPFMADCKLLAVVLLLVSVLNSLVPAVPVVDVYVTVVPSDFVKVNFQDSLHVVIYLFPFPMITKFIFFCGR